MEEYRVIKVQTTIGDINNEGYPFPDYYNRDQLMITSYLVQVKSFLFWHTVKTFKKILPAARLLHHLKNLPHE